MHHTFLPFTVCCADAYADSEVTLTFDSAIEVLQSCEGADLKETTTLDRLLKALNVIERDLEEEGV